MGITLVGFCDQWDEYERRDCVLMKELSVYTDVERIVYVQPPLPVTSLIKYVLHCADKYATLSWKQVFTKGTIYERNKITIVTSFSLLPYNDKYIFSSINVYIMNWIRHKIVKRLLKKYKVSTNLVVWISNPYFNSDLIGNFNEDLVCYNLCESYIRKKVDTTYRRVLIQEDRYISQKSNVFFMATNELVKEKEGYQNVYLVPNGVEYNTVQSGVEKPIPSDVQAIAHPIIGQVGIINDRTDYNLIKYLAGKRPGWSFLFIGPVSGKPKGYEEARKLPNVYFIGGKPAREIPSYIATFDICGIFYTNIYTNRVGSSMKLYQYLASGKPIVTYPVGDAQNIPELVYLAHNPEDYLEQIEHALDHDSIEQKTKRLTYAKNNSWEKRAELVHAVICKKLKQRKHS